MLILKPSGCEMLFEVDPERIGVIGHSLGGHNAMFLGVFDQRLKVIVSSCGWTPMHDYMGGNITVWAQDCYMPRLRDVYGLDAPTFALVRELLSAEGNAQPALWQ